MDGLSEEQLTIHFGLYNGYVNNVNTVLETMKNMSDAKEFGPAFAEIKRRFGWEFGGMRLHEQYFENMTKSASPLNPESALAKKITEDLQRLKELEIQKTKLLFLPSEKLIQGTN